MIQIGHVKRDPESPTPIKQQILVQPRAPPTMSRGEF